MLSPSFKATSQTQEIKNILEEPLHLAFEQKDSGFARVEIELASSEVLPWLSLQKSSTKLYWSSRDFSKEIAGIGILAKFQGHEALRSLEEHLTVSSGDIRAYGGCCFDATKPLTPPWHSFGSSCFVIPQFEFITQHEQSTLACNFWIQPTSTKQQQKEKILEEVQKLHFRTEFLPFHLPPLYSRLDTPSSQLWASIIEQALLRFEQKTLQKVVCARQSTFQFAEPFCPFLLLQELKWKTPDSFHFALQFEESATFLGATPELLYRRNQTDLESEAVAGTRRRGKTTLEDETLGQELLNSEKDLHEHRLVLQRIQALFQEHCLVFHHDPHPQLLKLAKVQHLYQKVQGKLKGTQGDKELLAQFHPTPAVGGVPHNEALAFIRETEAFSRGWYAAPIGWISKHHAEFAVAIRSGLAQGSTLNLFSGAGIVSGSTAQQEWAEIENKLDNFVQLFL
jgi:menaquinone-specific isochorismate synthase